MIVSIDLDPDEDSAPVTIEFGKLWATGRPVEPELLIRYDMATYTVEELRDHLRGLEDTRRKYQEIMTALGRA